jgi:hypothetical protein
MIRLDPDKLHVTYLPGCTAGDLILPRCYTLTHSDITGELFLSIGNRYCAEQYSGFYIRWMRDEVLAEFTYEEENPVFRLYCHVSGGFVCGTGGWRYGILCYHLPHALEAIRYGDRALFEQNESLDSVPVLIHFKSKNKKYDKVENWGTMGDYR